MSENLKLSNRVFAILAILAVGIMVFWGFRIFEIWRNANGDYPREITVDGEASAFVEPDIAIATIGVNTEGPTAEAIVATNTEKVNKIIAAVKAGGIADEDIKTVNYFMSPKYEWTEDRGSFQNGFTIDQSIQVKFRDLDKIGEVVGAATKAGANTISGIQFDIEDKDAALEDARDEAIAKAEAKAKMISERTGLKLIKVINYYEYSNQPYMYGGEKYYSDFAVAEEAMAPMPVIEPGQEEVTISVNLTYRVR